jgi:hypothetical protein
MALFSASLDRLLSSVGTVRDGFYGHERSRLVRTTLAQPSINDHQLDRRVRPVPGDHCLVRKGRRPAAVGLRSSNSAPRLLRRPRSERWMPCDTRSL